MKKTTLHNAVAAYAVILTIIILITSVYKAGVKEGRRSYRAEVESAMDVKGTTDTAYWAVDALLD